MIDIEDLKQVAKRLRQILNKKEDLNQDGIVDEKDVRFIEKNFLSVDRDVKGKAKDKVGKRM